MYFPSKRNFIDKPDEDYAHERSQKGFQYNVCDSYKTVLLIYI